MNFLQKNGRGILVCLVMAVPCWLLGQKFPIVGGPVFGILAGMIVTLLWRDKTAAQPGISFVSKKVLQYAVILLGFGMNLSVIWQTGKQSLPIIVVPRIAERALEVTSRETYEHGGRPRIETLTLK